jgi:hypothetical protein
VVRRRQDARSSENGRGCSPSAKGCGDALINGSWFGSALGLAIGLDRLKGKGVGSLDQFERNAG